MSNSSFIGALLTAIATFAASGQVTIQAPQVPAAPAIPVAELREHLVGGTITPHSAMTVVGTCDAVRAEALAALPDCEHVYQAQIAVAIAAATSKTGDHQPQKIQTVEKAVTGWVKVHVGSSESYVDHWVPIVVADAKTMGIMIEDQKVLARLNEPSVLDRMVWWWKR
jgi:hypothetical protein